MSLHLRRASGASHVLSARALLARNFSGFADRHAGVEIKTSLIGRSACALINSHLSIALQPELIPAERDDTPDTSFPLAPQVDILIVGVPTAAHLHLSFAARRSGREEAMDRKSTRLNSSHVSESRMPSSV